MKTYRQHHCEKQHQSERTFLRCAIRNAAWIEGNGEYAVIAWCDRPTITLWRTPTPAQAALQELNALRCGGQCRERHELIRIEKGG